MGRRDFGDTEGREPGEKVWPLVFRSSVVETIFAAVFLPFRPSHPYAQKPETTENHGGQTLITRKGKPVTTIPELNLTPAQMAEVMAADPDLVSAWLDETDRKHGLRSPAGYFVKGIRTGQPPTPQTDLGKTKAIERAERYMRVAGFHLPSTVEVEVELFGQKGILEPWAEDKQLVERMQQLWHDLESVAERVEREAIERAAHIK